MPIPTSPADPSDLDPRPLGELLGLASADEKVVLARATGVVGALLGDRGGCVLTDGDRARLVAATDAPVLREAPIDLGRWPEVRAGLDGATVVIADAASDPRLASVRALLPSSVRSVVVLPLDAGRGPIGALVARGARPGPPSARALATASAVARLAALLVDRARLAIAARMADDAEAARLGVARPPGRRVLLVEDEPSHVELVGAMLSRHGIAVEVAPDGAAALERARAEHFDLLLLDVRIPTVDGFSVAEALRRDPQLRDLPILFLSACDDVGSKVRALDLGAVDYLSKPFHGAELVARVERTLRAAAARSELKALARQDELTGLGNFRFLQERLVEECARSLRYRLPLSVVMLDVDGLKRTNDREGHAAGNALLARLGSVLRAEARESDAVARYGGDEFVALLPHTTLEDARRFAERLHRHLSDPPDGGPSVRVSIGLAALDPVRPATPAQLLAIADATLYRAKRAGGDRMCDECGDDGTRAAWRPGG